MIEERKGKYKGEQAKAEEKWREKMKI